MSKQTIYTIDDMWLPNNPVHYPMVVLYDNHAEIVLGDAALNPSDLREFAAVCIQAADDLEASK
jgi:hypothetical protein